MKPLCIACVLFVAASAGAQNRFVYVNTQTDPNIITGYQINNSNGALTQLADAPFSTGGIGSNAGTSGPMNSMAIVPRGSAIYFYAANDNDPSISTFTLNPQTGNLTLVGSPMILNDDSGVYNMAVTPNYQLLYVTNATSDDIHAFAISATGALTEIAGSPFEAGAQITSLHMTANGRFLLAAANSIDAVEVFSIASSGALAQISGSPFPSSLETYSVVSNCDNNLVYDVSYSGPEVEGWKMASDGSLTAVPGSPFPTLAPPESGGGGNGSFDLVLSPNDRYLFTTDTFSSDDSSLGVGRGGALVSVPGSPFTTSDWEGGVAVTAAGDYLYSVQFASEDVDGRAIGRNGELTAIPGTPFPSAPGYPQYTVGDSIITYPTPTCHP
jgi:6-phosphogluconolactonase